MTIVMFVSLIRTLDYFFVGKFFVDVHEANVYRGQSIVAKEYEDSVIMLTEKDLQVALSVDLEDYPESPIYLQNRRLLEEELYCDIEIECNDGTLAKCHKSVLAGMC